MGQFFVKFLSGGPCPRPAYKDKVFGFPRSLFIKLVINFSANATAHPTPEKLSNNIDASRDGKQLKKALQFKCLYLEQFLQPPLAILLENCHIKQEYVFGKYTESTNCGTGFPIIMLILSNVCSPLFFHPNQLCGVNCKSI